MQDDFEFLGDLFADARQHINAERLAAAKTPRRTKSPDASPQPDAAYTNPENWTRTRCIALVHEDSQTLLGNFTEWKHRTDAGARKLIREEGLVAVAGTEFVAGDWWLREEVAAEAAEPWHTKREAVLHLVLPSMHVHAPDTPVIVSLSYGGITRVELEFATTFGQISGAQEQLLQLPAGVNVLPMMSQDSKVALRVELAE